MFNLELTALLFLKASFLLYINNFAAVFLYELQTSLEQCKIVH